jgi:MFS family permease
VLTLRLGRFAAALGDFYGPLNLLAVMCAINAILCLCVFGASTAPGLILIAILYGISSGVFNSIMAPALMSFAKNNNEIGIRMGLGFLICGFGALGGTPVIGVLLEKTGWIGPVMFSGVTVILGTVMVAISIFYQRREKVTWRV